MMQAVRRLCKTGRAAALVLVWAMVTAAFAAAASAAPETRTQGFPNNDDGFTAFAKAIDANHGRNLLARKSARAFSGDVSPRELTDGSAGVRGGDGRVNINGQPSIVAFYLGEAKPVHELALYTYNGDTRANQDFEVRLADNSANPGKMPKFDGPPLATSGSTVVGQDGGGFRTAFVAPGGGPLVPGKVDWVEFRIWRTYPLKAGSPARSDKANGWSAAIEVEALGEPSDVIVISAEEKARRAALSAMSNRPPYEKKATWQETMAAYREGILRWECEMDALVQERAGIRLGPWHVLGPVKADSDAARQIKGLRELDLAKPVALKGKDAPSPAWKPFDAFKDGQMADLAALAGAKPGDTVFLARTMELETEYAGNEALPVGVGMVDGRLRIVGGRSAMDAKPDAGPPVPNQVTWDIRDKPGRYHLMAAVVVGADGKAPLWLMVQPPINRPGAGNKDQRLGRRRDAFRDLERDFADVVSRTQMLWEKEDSIWVRFQRREMAGRTYFMTDWAPGSPEFLVEQYNAYAAERLGKARDELSRLEPAIRDLAGPWVEKAAAAAAPATVADARRRYYAVAAVQEAMAEHHRIASMRLAVLDQQATFPDKYTKGAEYLQRIAAIEQKMIALWPDVLAGTGSGLPPLLDLRAAADAEGQDILLANPVLAFDKLLLGRGGPGFGSNWGNANRIGDAIVTLSPVRPDGKITPVYAGGNITDMDLDFDAKKILFSMDHHIHEVNVDGTGHRQITNQTDPHVQHYDACRLPDGNIVFVSSACEQAVPCTGQWYVGNLHLMDGDGKNERRLTYDQDHDWNPAVLNNGQVVYTRWEYTDTPHYFTRLLFSMNPDGTSQAEFYGSNSYWPNAMYWPRPIPGHPSQVVCIVSGHHGVSRVGQMVVLDSAQGRHEADGVVHRIGDRGRKVVPVIEDGLVAEWWPRYAMPYPLAEPGTNRGAGRYFLANVQADQWSPWRVVLVDVFDNVTTLLEGSYANPVPLLPRPRPQVIPPRVDLERRDGLVYLWDVTRGPGLAGVPRGTVKALRLGSHVYRYGDNGDTRAATFEGGWDVKRILGTVPVEPDGSAYFRVPANTPIFVQPLDADGKALQTMRSWFVAMPGETLSCVGCHERQAETPPVTLAQAVKRGPSEIEPWFGPARGFSWECEVQPVLDRRCVGCHDGQKREGLPRPDFRSKQALAYTGNYSPAYLALAAYVRRAGYEADYHMARTAEWTADTSPLFQMLEKGHHNVRLTPEERNRLYAWVDFNVPYAGNWSESHRPPQAEQVDRRAKYMKQYALVEDTAEAPLAAAPAVAFEAPQPEAPAPERARLDGWPMTPEAARALQDAAGLKPLELDLSGGVKMTLVPVPGGRFVMGDAAGLPDERPERVVSIAEPFYMGRLEVTNRQFSRFDPTHDSAYIDGRGKDRFTRGYPANEPDQPVIRVTQEQALEFAAWLSRLTGYECSLPTEEQWEWACRAGTDTPWSFGAKMEGLSNVANFSDGALGGWAFGRNEPGYNDGVRFSAPAGQFSPNAWGLCDMHGNVAEWTLSDYRLPQGAAANGNDRLPAGLKVVRGGSWFDTARFARSGSRWRYPAWQPVFNVGFRIVARPTRVAQK